MAPEAFDTRLTGEASGDETARHVQDADPAWYWLALKAARLGLWRYDLETGLVHLDERMRNIWGEPMDAAALPVQALLQRVHPDDREHVAETVRAALNPQSSGEYEIDYRIVWPDGTQRWVAAN